MHVKKILYLLFFSVSFLSLLAQEIPDEIKDSAYFDSTLSAFTKGNNTKRYQFVKKYSKRENLKNLIVKTEPIDWLGIYRNVIVEKKGESDSIVYVVCHYDKIDGNIFSLVNTFINGNLDVLLSNAYLSKGVYDNGSGVVTSLSLLSWISRQSTHYTYRFLFAGMEEFGLRGSRRHVSRLKETEWDKCFYALNIDMVGKKGINGITVTQNVSDSCLVKISEKVCEASKYKLSKAKMPVGALGDYYSFKGQNFGKDFKVSLMSNMIGAFIPQRSYFTRDKKAIPIINLTDEASLTFYDFLSMYSPISFGEIHSFKDQPKVVDTNNLVTYHGFIKELLLYIDKQRNLRL